MKGLLLKDAYMAAKYCRAYLLIVAVFLIAAPFSGDNLFLMTYPCILASMVPVNLMAYDTQSKWEQYAGTLPCSRDQLVSAKYLIGLLASCGILALTGIVQSVRVATGSIQVQALASLMALALITSCIVPAITLPLIFRFGPEKGRILYLVVVGMACGISAAVSITQSPSLFSREISLALPVLGLACLAAAGLYGASWYLSILFYKKRELK
ncbi:MAG: ABC-2 transporter permease [Faecousia sp.]